MKLYLSVDIEGVTGVNTSTQLEGEDFIRFRRQMTHEVNSAINGAKESGATEFVVNDAHGPMTNILIEELDDDARLISGSNKQLCQMEGINGSFDGVFFIGYHAGSGCDDGVLNHTVLSKTVNRISCNGEVFDEAAINAGLAGYFDVPVALLTGDDIVCANARDRFKGIYTAEVKKAIDRYTANSLSLNKAAELIENQAKESVKRLTEIEPYKIGPVTFEVEFKETCSANMCELFPQIKRINSMTIQISGDDYLATYKQLWGSLILGRSVQGGLL
jgi:D-amino peptidase